MRKLFYRKSEALKAIEILKSQYGTVEINEREVDVRNCDDFDDEANYKLELCSGTVNGYEILNGDGNEIAVYAYWLEGFELERDDVETMDALADYINEREQVTPEVQDIIRERGWNPGRDNDEIAWRKSGEDTEEVVAVLANGKVDVLEIDVEL